MQTIKRFFDHLKGSYFLFGPRGTGKSTWLREQHSDAAWIDLLDTVSERSYSARPERLKEFSSANREKGTIVIDEVQRVPQLLSIVHQQMETDKSLRFILTGSSARKIRQSGVDLLAGRAILRTMHPFLAAELGTGFDLEESLRFGMVPLVRTADDPRETLRSYIDLYLQQEIKTERIVRRVDDFNRFLETVSFSHAHLLNVTAISRECTSSRTTVESYVSILEDLLLGVRVPVFSRRAKRLLVSHAKFYFFDCGVYRSIRPAGPLDLREEVEGPSLEGLVFQHLRAWIDYRRADMKIHFWRTRAGNEVDFILYGSEGFHAIEVKNSRSIRPTDLHGLKAFRTDFPEAIPLLLYRGEETIDRDDIRCMPVDLFLKRLDPKQSFPR
jgi:predicted AAA+ superfamily ATPase